MVLGAEDRKGTHVHGAGDTRLDGCREQATRSFDVDVHGLSAIEPVADEPGGVEEAIDALDRPAKRSLVGHVALHELYPERAQVGGAGGIAHERSHLVAALDERARQPVADEARAARDERDRRPLRRGAAPASRETERRSALTSIPSSESHMLLPSMRWPSHCRV